MELNLYRVVIPNKVKRIFYYNPENSPEQFSRNMSRINNIKFVHSSDLVWVELPFTNRNVKILPEHSNTYKREEQVVENDVTLFVKTLYSYIEKLFKDNKFAKAAQHLYMSLATKTPLRSCPEVSHFEAYRIRIHQIDEKFYLSINPRLVFLSTNPALNSKVKSAFLLNITSGRSFPFVCIENGKLVIQINEQSQKEVSQPENYFFNFSPKEMERLKISKEIYELYSNKIPSLFKKIPTELKFLEELISVDKPYFLKQGSIKNVGIVYQFAKGKSSQVKDIFQLGWKVKPNQLKIVLLFPDKFSKAQREQLMSRLISDDSIYMRTLKSIVPNIQIFKTIEFSYREEDLELLNVEKLETLPNGTVAIVLLSKTYNGLGKFLKEFPKNLIVLPILVSKIVENQIYVLKSFAYKTINFIPGSQPYHLSGLSNGALYVGFDLSHDHHKRRSDYAFAAVDSKGKILYVDQKLNLKLDERFDMNLLLKDITRSVDLYTLLNGVSPKTLFLIRDGLFIESTTELKNHLDLFKMDYVIIEINKNSNINSPINLKGKLIELQKNKYVYFADTHNLQRGVEINIHTNRSNLSEEQIAHEIYLTTELFHPTPYVNLKLPYPIYIVDKVSLLKDEWKLYIPYFQHQNLKT
ncbi:hypothetical protein [Pseudothermotoga sp.]|uniref:protein argonaute n=1 Tax=Pseudothermotoga sp. TaxID=2033661 RepID=UPI0031F6D5BF